MNKGVGAVELHPQVDQRNVLELQQEQIRALQGLLLPNDRVSAAEGAKHTESAGNHLLDFFARFRFL